MLQVDYIKLDECKIFQCSNYHMFQKGFFAYDVVHVYITISKEEKRILIHDF